MTRGIALAALAALGLTGDPVHGCRGGVMTESNRAWKAGTRCSGRAVRASLPNICGCRVDILNGRSHTEPGYVAPATKTLITPRGSGSALDKEWASYCSSWGSRCDLPR
jgi:hypothetical protein